MIRVSFAFEKKKREKKERKEKNRQPPFPLRTLSPNYRSQRIGKGNNPSRAQIPGPNPSDLLVRRHMGGDPGAECGRVSSLDEYCSGAYCALDEANKKYIMEEWIPVNLQTRPSAADILLMIPPEATRSMVYLQFQATK